MQGLSPQELRDITSQVSERSPERHTEKRMNP